MVINFGRMITEDIFPCEVFEVGSPSAYSMGEMVALMAQQMGIRRYVKIPVPALVFKLLFTITWAADADQMNTIYLDRVIDSSRFTETFEREPTDFRDGVSYLIRGDGRWPL